MTYRASLALFACACTPTTTRAFLSKLPLEVTTISPAGARGAADSAPRSLSGRDAITVVFSRAVIALGADFDASPPAFSITPAHVPGRFRWVTTAIARFDPSTDWPPDLTLDVAPIAGLVAFDGAQLAGASAPVRFRTPALRMWLDVVDSPAARNATGGLWDASTATVDERAREVPPDGSVRLRFSESIAPKLALAALELRGVGTASLSRVPALLLGCDQDPAADNRTLCVRPAEPLEASTSYDLRLKQGFACHPTHGRTSAVSEVRLSGLEPFFFPYLQRAPPPAVELYRALRPRFRRLDFWLKHGLALRPPLGADAVLAALRTATTIEPPLNFNLSRPAPGVLRIEAPLQGATRYTVRIDPAAAKRAAVTDAFGQSLGADPRPSPATHVFSALTGRLSAAFGSAGESTTFDTAELPTFFADSDVAAHFAPPGGAPRALRVWARGADQCFGAGDANVRGMRSGCAPADPTQRAAWLAPLIAAARNDGQRRRRLEHDGRFGLAYNVTLAPVTSATLPHAIATVLSSEDEFIQPVSWASAPLTDALTPLEVPTGPALAPSGLAVRTKWDSYNMWANVRADSSGARKSSSWLGTPRYGALVLASVVPSGARVPAGELALWVTRLDAPGGPAAGARVRLFAYDSRRHSGRSVRAEDVAEVASGETDARGIALLELPRQWADRREVWEERLGEPLTLFAAIDSKADGDGHISLISGVQPRPRVISPIGAAASLVTDASMYRQGETVRVKGWIRERATAPADEQRASSPLARALADVRDGGAIESAAADASAAVATAMALAVPPRERRQLLLRVRWRAPNERVADRGYGFVGEVDGEGGFAGASSDALSSRSASAPPARSEPDGTPVACGEYVPPDGSACASVWADDEYGAFDAQLAVPLDAEHTHTTIELVRVDMAAGDGDAPAAAARYTDLATAAVTIAEPRPPTATLNLETIGEDGAPVSSFSTFADGKLVRLRVRTATYTGSAIGGSEVALHWDVSTGDASEGPPSAGASARAPGASWVGGLAALGAERHDDDEAAPMREAGGALVARSEPPSTSGVVRVTTGSEDGVVVVALDADSQPEAHAALRRAREGGSLSVRAEWVGPTRELVTAHASISAAADESGAQLDIALATADPLPGFEFAVATHLSRSGSSVSEHAALDVALYALAEAPSEADVRARGALAGSSPPVSHARCTSGAATFDTADGGCALRMPDAAARYVLVACTVADAPPRACAAVRVGHSPATWQRAPLRSLSAQSSALFIDRPAYAVGDALTVAWHSQFADGAHALALWGDEGTLRAVALGPLARGANRLTLRVGSECATGCSLTLALASGARAAELNLPAGVSRSPLFDSRMPLAGLWTLRIAVEHAPRALAVALAVRSAGGDGTSDAAALPPGSAARVRVRVTDAATGAPVRGQVSLVIVDKAMLDVSPHPLARPADAFERLRTRGAPDAVAQLALLGHADAPGSTHESALLSERAHGAAASALERLFAREPWLDPPRGGAWAAAAFGFGPYMPGVRTGSLAECVEQPEDEALAPLRSVLTSCPAGCDWDGNHAAYAPGFRGDGRLFRSQRNAMRFADDSVMMMEGAGAMAVAMMAAPEEGDAPVRMRAAPSAAVPSAEALAKSAGGGGGGADGAPAGASVPALRTHFARVALFAPSIAVPESGEVEVPWQLPDNVGTWLIRAYAAAASPHAASAGAHALAAGADPASAFGSAELPQLAARPLSLVPSVPRFARVGDRFEAGVSARIVDAHALFALAAGAEGAAAEGAAVHLELRVTVAVAEGEARTPPLLVEPAEGEGHAGDAAVTRVVRFADALAPIELAATLRAVALGHANLTLAVRVLRASDGALLAADSLAHALDVEAASPAVVVATSFSVDGDDVRVRAAAAAAERAVALGLAPAAPATASASADGANCALLPWTEGLALPAAVPGSGSLAITAGVGYEAAARQLAERAAASAVDATVPTARANALEWTSTTELLAGLLGAPLANGTYAPDAQPAATSARWYGLALAEVARRSLDDGTGLCSLGGRWCVPYAQRARTAFGRRGEQLPPEALVDTRLLSFALLLLAEAELGGSLSAEPDTRAPALVRALASSWASALARALAWRASEAADAAHSGDTPSLPPSELCWAAAALGVGWADELRAMGASRATHPAVGTPAPSGPPAWAADARAAAVEGAASVRSARARALLGSSALHAALEGSGADSECDALVALAALRPPPPALADGAHAMSGDAEGALRRLVGALRVTGRTSFIAAGPGLQNAAPVRTQALALRAFAAATATSGKGAPVELVPRLAMVVANSEGAGGAHGGWRYGGWGGDGETSALRLAALCAYDLATGSAAPQLRFEALAGARPLLRAAFARDHAPASRVRLPWEAISASRGVGAGALPSALAPRGGAASLRDAEPLIFFARGTGRVGVAVELSFAPAPQPGSTAPRYRGLYVERVFRAPGGAGGALHGPLLLGSLVEVSISITSADDVSGLVVEDRPPAGLEPLDPAVYGGASAPASSGLEPCPVWYGWLGSWWRGGWGVCEPTFERDISPSLVRWRAQWAGAGTHTLSYTAMVATAGEFALAPAHAYLSAQPELMGLSTAGQLAVARVLPTGGAPARAQQPPKECVDPECAGRGSCDVLRGVCECAPGWEGDGCADESAQRVLRVEPWPTSASAPAGPRGSVRFRFGLVKAPPHGRRLAPLADSAHRARFAYAFSSDQAVLPSSAINVDAETGVVQLNPAPGARPGSAYVTIAASEDGAQLHSALVLVNAAADGRLAALPLELLDEGDALGRTAAGLASAGTHAAATPAGARGSQLALAGGAAAATVGAAAALALVLARRMRTRGRGFLQLDPTHGVQLGAVQTAASSDGGGTGSCTPSHSD